MTALSAQNLEVSLEDVTILDGVDIDVASGEIHALVGLNGAGKTTLMRTLLGMLTPSAGTVEIDAIDIRSMSGEQWGSVGYLIDTPFAYPELTVTENLHAVGRLRGLARTEVTNASEKIVRRLDLGQWSERRHGTLSLGNRQRAGLAAALVHEPSLLILDEPVNALDPAGVVLVRELLRELAKNDAAVLVSSHHLDEIARIADRISVMHRGRMVGTLDPADADLERRFFEIAYQAELGVS